MSKSRAKKLQHSALAREVQHSALAREGMCADKVMWRIPEWCAAVSLPRCTYYLLGEHAPRAIKIGSRTRIVEHPAEWVARIAARGGLPKLRSAA